MCSLDGFDILPETLPCPVCLELPRKNVFQCQNGHLLCETCYAQLTLCPQCRLPFEPRGIRSLTVEMLLDGSAFDINCIYEGSGCKMKVDNLKRLQEHAECCRFSPSLSICKKLGFQNCTFKMNREITVEGAIHHFETAHGTLDVTLSNLKTTAVSTPASFKLDRIPNILLCSVCRKLPVTNVFQCRKGHILCEECNAREMYCPKCRIRLRPPIRSLAVEMLLDEFQLSFELNCNHKGDGCPIRMTNLKSFRDHVKSCNYRVGLPIDLCKALGFGTCSFQMTTGTAVEEAIQHFESVHGASTTDSEIFEVKFEDCTKYSGGRKLIISNQKLKGYAHLFLARHERSRPLLRWTPFYLKYPTLRQDENGLGWEDLLITTTTYPPYILERTNQPSVPLLDILKFSDHHSSTLDLFLPPIRKSPVDSVFVKITAGTSRRMDQAIPRITISSSEMKEETGSGSNSNLELEEFPPPRVTTLEDDSDEEW